MSLAEYTPWEVIEGPFKVSVPWAYDTFGVPATHVRLHNLAAACASDVLELAEVIAIVRLREYGSELAAREDED